MEDNLKPFWSVRDDLYMLEDVVMMNDRMYVPQSLRGEVLECLHFAHQGEMTMKSATRSRFFWPGMDAAIKQKRKQCRACNEMAPSQSREEAIPAEMPNHPFQDLCVDFFSHEGRSFAAMCDRFSGYLMVKKPAATDFQ